MPKYRRSKKHTVPPTAPPPAPRAADRPLPVIKVVGISGSGKSTLVRGLRAVGYEARPISQEHSSVPDLWQQFDRPAALIYLNASLENQRSRRPDVTWSDAAYQLETGRLRHARDHADLKIDTGGLSPAAVLRLTLLYLQRARVHHADHPLLPLPATGSAASLRPR